MARVGGGPHKGGKYAPFFFPGLSSPKAITWGGCLENLSLCVGLQLLQIHKWMLNVDDFLELPVPENILHFKGQNVKALGEDSAAFLSQRTASTSDFTCSLFRGRVHILVCDALTALLVYFFEQCNMQFVSACVSP